MNPAVLLYRMVISSDYIVNSLKMIVHSYSHMVFCVVFCVCLKHNILHIVNLICLLCIIVLEFK